MAEPITNPLTDTPAHPQHGSSTQSVHAGAAREKTHHALTESVTHTATYTFRNTQDLSDFMDARLWGLHGDRTEYGRYGNPTVTAAEKRIAALEGASDTVLFSSGMAAVTTTLLAILSAGSHIIMTDDSYRRTR